MKNSENIKKFIYYRCPDPMCKSQLFGFFIFIFPLFMFISLYFTNYSTIVWIMESLIGLLYLSFSVYCLCFKDNDLLRTFLCIGVDSIFLSLIFFIISACFFWKLTMNIWIILGLIFLYLIFTIWICFSVYRAANNNLSEGKSSNKKTLKTMSFLGAVFGVGLGKMFFKELDQNMAIIITGILFIIISLLCCFGTPYLLKYYLLKKYFYNK